MNERCRDGILSKRWELLALVLWWERPGCWRRPPHRTPRPAKPIDAKVPLRTFGKTGVKVSSLALGGIFDISSNQLQLKQSLDWGVTYWDTASGYNGGKSETGIGMYFEKHPEVRKSVFLVTKASGAHSVDQMTQSLAQSLERMKTDYVDMFFLHGIPGTKDLTPEVKAWAEKAKTDKKIRFFGFSTHSNMDQCLTEAAQLGWIDGIMLAYNYRVMHTDAMKAALEAAAKAGIGLTAMKTQAKRQQGAATEAESKLLQNFLGRGFTQEQACLKAVWENPQIASVCSQMPNLTILASNVAAAIDQTSLTPADKAALQQHAEATCSFYCAGCTRLCEAALGRQVPVGDVMRSLMYHHGYGDIELSRSVLDGLPEGARRRLYELDYAAAERVCPQRMPIAALMKEAAGLLA